MIKLFLFFSLLIPRLVNAESFEFDVTMNGKSIGSHLFTLTDQDQKQRALKSEAIFNVKLLSFNVFKYHHVADEIWDEDCLKSLEAKTQENSKVTVVNGIQEKSNFKVNASKPIVIHSECVMTFAYWNPRILAQKKLLNPQTGEYLTSNISHVGKETISIKGQSVEAEHYKIDTTKFKIDIWYSAEGKWLSLESLTSDGKIYYTLK
jgi:hypothetical protein